MVLAARVGTPLLCAALGITVPVSPSPALLVRFSAPPAVVNTVVSSPDVEVRQNRNGTLFAAASYSGETTRSEIQRTAVRILAGVRSTFSGADDLSRPTARVGMRPMPADEEPLVETTPGVDGLYLAVMHSAVTLAPAVGRLVANELVDGVRGEALAGCPPGRLVRFDSA